MHRFALTVMICLSVALGAPADEHRVEVIKEPPPQEEYSKALQGQFSEQGLRVIRGSSRTVCEIWPCKHWQTKEGFKATSERLYPFEAGQLIGLLHFSRRGKDFREQTVGRGWYTLRFGLQPVDGNHEGTSPTRDFLLMVPAEKDTSLARLGVDEANEASAEAAGSAHPAMLCLQPTKKDVKKAPSMYHDEERDWWVLRFAGKAGSKQNAKPLPIDLIVVGHADE